MFTVADHLIPLFKTGSTDDPLARDIAIGAIDAYRPETRADYVNVARTIAFSMAAIALLGDAAATDMPMPEKMRLLGRAVALNRSADQSERTMIQRRRYQQAALPDELAEPHRETPATAADETQMQTAIADAMNEYLGVRPAPSATAPMPMPTPEPARCPSPLPAPDPAAPADLPRIERRPKPSAVAPAEASVTDPRYGGTRADAALSQAASYKASLLGQTAMPRTVAKHGDRSLA